MAAVRGDSGSKAKPRPNNLNGINRCGPAVALDSYALNSSRLIEGVFASRGARGNSAV